MNAYFSPAKRARSAFKRAALGATALFAIIASSSVAMAAPIMQTSFGVSGGFSLPSGTSLATTNSLFITNGGAITVTSPGSFDLGAITGWGVQGTLQDIPSFSSFVPISNFLTLTTGVAVDLNTLIVLGQSGPAPGFINMAGNAVIHAPGFDPTPGLLSFTGTTSDNISFSLSIITSALSVPENRVPEPMSLALVGLGLIGVAGAHKSRKNKAV